MKRYEVVTPVGYVVAVPLRIWRAWPAANRRVVEVTLEEHENLLRLEAGFDAGAIGGSK